MSSFTIETSFKPGDEIKVLFDISNSVPSTTGKTAYIVDLKEGNPHSVTVPISGGTSAEAQIANSENIHWSNVNEIIGLTPSHPNDGESNTTQIINQTGHITSAAKVASDISRTVGGEIVSGWVDVAGTPGGGASMQNSLFSVLVGNDTNTVLLATDSTESYSFEVFIIATTYPNPSLPAASIYTSGSVVGPQSFTLPSQTALFGQYYIEITSAKVMTFTSITWRTINSFFGTATFVLNTYIIKNVSGPTYSDWFLPSGWHLSSLYNLMSTLDPVISSAGGSPLAKPHQYAVVKNYWSSDESSYAGAVFSTSFHPSTGGGSFQRPSKSHAFRVRAVRKQSISSYVDAKLSVGDLFGGGVIYKIIDTSTAVVPKVDLDINIGFGKTNIFSQNQLASGFSNSAESGLVELKITSAHGSNPTISFDYTNSNAGSYTWLTNVKVFKKVEEIAEVVQAGSKSTIAWNEAAQRWTTRYSFTPEYFSSHKTTFASFVKGELYIHDDSNNKNYFYNGKYPTQISYVENIQPSQPKVFMTHAVEGNAKPTITRFETVDNWTMNSDLNANDYVKKEGTYYSELFGDTNDPNVADNATYGDKLMRGTKLRGQYLKVFMAFRQEDLEVKHSNIGFITSKGHTT